MDVTVAPPTASGLKALFWAILATLLEGALRHRASIWRVINILPLVLGAGIAFVLGRIVGLALSGVF
jgi:hypothetical protein